MCRQQDHIHWRVTVFNGFQKTRLVAELHAHEQLQRIGIARVSSRFHNFGESMHLRQRAEEGR